MGSRLDPQRLFEGPGWRNLRVGSDIVALVAAPLAALAAAPDSVGPDGHTLLWLQGPMTIALLALWGLYASRTQPRMLDAVGKIIAATSLATIVLIASAAFIQPDSQPAPLLARGWLYGTLFVIGTRLLLTWTQSRSRAAGLAFTPTLIIGAGVVSSHVEMRLNTQPRLGLRPVGYLDANPPPDEMVPERTAAVLGTPDDLERVVAETGARHVVFGFLSGPDRELLPLMRRCEALGLQVSFVPRFFESVNVHLALEHLGGLPLFGLRPIDPKGWQFAIKHVFDRTLAAGALVLLAPLLAALAAGTRLSSPGPVLFRQRRIGRDGHGFDMLKFRSMRLRARRPRRRRGGRQRGPAARRHRARRGRGRRPADMDRIADARHLHGRAAAALQRAPWRHEPGRAPARAPRVRGVVRLPDRPLPGPSPGQVGRHRLGPGARAAGQDVAARQGRVGQLLHRELVAGA